jgi:hypothetical protein
MHASNIGLAGASPVSGIFVLGEPGALATGVFFSNFGRGCGAGSADMESARGSKRIATMRSRQPDARIMAGLSRSVKCGDAESLLGW